MLRDYGEERWEAPVSYATREMQTGLPEVGLKIGLEKVASTLRADVGRSVLMHALVGAEAAAIGEHHGASWAHLSSELKPGESVRSGLSPIPSPNQAPTPS